MKKLLISLVLSFQIFSADWIFSQYYTPMGTAVPEEKIVTKMQKDQETRISIFKDVYIFYFPRVYTIDGDKLLDIKIIGLDDLTAVTVEGRALNGEAGKCFTVVTKEEELKKLIKRNKEIMFQLTQNTAINQTFNVEGFEKIETKLSSLDWSKIEKIKDKEEAEAILKY